MIRSKLPVAAVFAVLAAAGLVLPALAQPWKGVGTLGLEVKAGRRDPLEGAQVRLRYAEIDPIDGPPALSTGADGRIEVQGLAAGRWRVDISKEGYSSYLLVVAVESHGETRIVSGPVRDATGDRMRIELFEVRPTALPEPSRPPVRREPTPAPEPEPPARPAPTPVRPEPTPPAPVRPEPAPAPAEAEPAEAESAEPEPAAPEPEPMPEPTPPEPESSPEPPAPAAEPEPEAPEAAPVAPAQPPSPVAEPEEVRPPESLAAPEPEPPAEPPPAAEPDAAPTAPAEEPGPVPEPSQVPPPPEPPAEEPEPAMPSAPVEELEPEEVPQPPAPAPQRPPEPAPPVTEPPPVEEPEPAPPVTEPPPVEEPEPAAPPAARAPALEAPAAEAPAPERPAPARPSTQPSTRTAEPPPLPRISATVRSAEAGDCPECQPGQGAVMIEQLVGASGLAPAEDCVADLAERLDRIAAVLAGAGVSEAGPLISGTGGALQLLRGTSSASEVAALVTPFLRRDSSCQALVVVLPPDARYAAYSYEASDAFGSGPCTAGEECAIGSASWAGEPTVVHADGLSLVYGVFRNESQGRQRRAVMTIYYSP